MMAQAEEAEEAVVPPPPVEENESVLILDPGTLVRLHSLQAVAMNGKTGTIVKYENESKPAARRYQVAIDDPKVIDKYNKIVRIKPENLTPISFVESMTIQGFHIVECTPFELTNSSTESHSSTNTSKPTMMVLGGGSYNPSVHFDFLPRNAKLPSRKFVFYNEICEKLVYKMYNEEDFVVAWKYVHVEGKTDIKRRFIEFRGGFKESHVRECFPNDGHLSSALKRGPLLTVVRVNVFTFPLPDEQASPFLDFSEMPDDAARLFAHMMQEEPRVTKEILAEQGKERDERVYMQEQPNLWIPEIRQGCADDVTRSMSYRLLHHVLRQHGAKLTFGMPKHICCIIYPYFAPNNESGKSTTKKMLEFLDLQTTRVDIDASVQGFTYCDTLTHLGEALEALEYFELAGRVYVWAAENFRLLRKSDSEWQSYMNGGIAYRRAKMIVPAEQCYVKALQWKYKRDGNRLVINDSNFTILMNNFLTMYSSFAGNGESSVVTSVEIIENHTFYNCHVIGALINLVHAAGFREAKEKFSKMVAKNVLKPKYRKTSAALAVLIEAFQQGTVDGFRSKILGCMEENCRNNKVFQFLFCPDPVLESQIPSPGENARSVIHDGCRSLNATTIISCSHSSCQNQEILDTTEMAAKGKFMQCPCRTATYCSKACQTAHWKEHKKKCPVHLAKKKR